ncbi:MAG: GGDEF domain-containing protein [Parvibaculum sp.]|uniref:GGDEF domain-containing protein n=1 Tax=Parvibaculum sp. TaxID=2024848 RepID=UPI0025F18902|nr:GGDEF domain-containing protein [Parvibaculum sp.]MCE9648958.1 GGDEF domain-containing protein [Parvibaculum sp.]
MRRAKLAIGTEPPGDDRFLPAADEATNRFRRSVSDSRIAANPDRLVAKALSYAAEAEQRIIELNARVAHLENMAMSDELTGLLNRRGFNAVLRRNLLSAARYDEAGILAYLDLDKFKKINDRHGHPVGDEVLRTVGRHLHRSIRATDYAARLGGDEFAILFVRARQAPARERARQLVRGLNKLVIPSAAGDVAVHASLGLAYYDGTSEAIELLDRADRAMYADKTKGSRAARMIING